MRCYFCYPLSYSSYLNKYSQLTLIDDISQFTVYICFINLDLNWGETLEIRLKRLKNPDIWVGNHHKRTSNQISKIKLKCQEMIVAIGGKFTKNKP